MKKALWLAFAAAVILNGCSFEPWKATWASSKHTPTKTCSDKDPKCELTITVTACTPDGIAIDHDVLGVLTGSRDVKIDWIIATPGYAFQDDGVHFKTDGWQKEFDQPKAAGNKYRWRDRNNAGGPPAREYSYGITVVKSDGSPCATKDPTVINDD